MQKFTRGYCCLGNGWEWGTGTIIVIMGSFPHSRSEADRKTSAEKADRFPLADGRESPVENGVLSHYSWGFNHAFGGAGLPSTVC